MKKKVFLINVLILYSFVMAGCVGTQLSQEQLKAIDQKCKTQNDNSESSNFIYSDGECVEYYYSGNGFNDEINLIIHGSWKHGSNPLKKYEKWADFLAENYGITTIAIAMPGYSQSSKNRFKGLKWDGCEAPYANKRYLNFASSLVQNFKNKYKAKKINGIGQSAGANIFSTLAGYNPELLNKVVMLAGEAYIDDWCNSKGNQSNNLSAIDYIDNISKTEFLLIAGDKDRFDRLESSYRFQKDLSERNISATVISVTGAGHNVDQSESVWNDVGKFIIQ